MYDTNSFGQKLRREKVTVLQDQMVLPEPESKVCEVGNPMKWLDFTTKYLSDSFRDEDSEILIFSEALQIYLRHKPLLQDGESKMIRDVLVDLDDFAEKSNGGVFLELGNDRALWYMLCYHKMLTYVGNQTKESFLVLCLIKAGYHVQIDGTSNLYVTCK